MHINHKAKGQGDSLLVWHTNLGTSSIYAFVDVIAQGVLVRRKLQKNPGFSFLTLSQIYRCWVVWNRKLAVVVVPSILASISLSTFELKSLENCTLTNSG